MVKPGKKIVILQPNYIPWKGFFDLMAYADEFVFYDDVQFTKNDWRNRNLIKTSSGVRWLTIPVFASGRFGQAINKVEVADTRWPTRHWNQLSQSYSKSKFFRPFAEELEEVYLGPMPTRLVDINYRFIEVIRKFLKIGTALVKSSSLEIESRDRSERLVKICGLRNASSYVTGPAGLKYLDLSKFQQAGIGVECFDYSGYLEYPQLHQPFVHQVSVLDLLFNIGPESRAHLLNSSKKLGL